MSWEGISAFAESSGFAVDNGPIVCSETDSITDYRTQSGNPRNSDWPPALASIRNPKSAIRNRQRGETDAYWIACTIAHVAVGLDRGRGRTVGLPRHVNRPDADSRAVMVPGRPMAAKTCPDGYQGAPYHGPGPMPYSEFTGPMPMGEGGTCPPVGYDLMGDVGIEGPLVDQRGPYYFDVRAEAVYLERDETFGRERRFHAERTVAEISCCSAISCSTIPSRDFASWADTTSARCRSLNSDTWASTTSPTRRGCSDEPARPKTVLAVFA